MREQRRTEHMVSILMVHIVWVTKIEKEILAQRKQVYQQAKAKHPERWSGEIRNWDEITEVYLNPENEKNKAA